jgi:hypothetical protein
MKFVFLRTTTCFGLFLTIIRWFSLCKNFVKKLPLWIHVVSFVVQCFLWMLCVSYFMCYLNFKLELKSAKIELFVRH